MAKKKSPGKKPQDTDEDDTKESQEGSDDQDSDEDEDDAAEENRRINAIVTSRVKREMKGVLASLSALSEKLDSLAKSKPDDSDESDGDEDTEADTSKKESQVDPKLARKLTKLEKELADERAARKKAEQEKAEEAERSKKTEMRNIFDAALTELGCTDPMLRRSALRLLEEDGIMIRDEDGKVKFKGQDKYQIETLYDPKAGLKSWIASDGKSFVPAVDAGGSGTGGARGVNNSNISPGDLKKMSPQKLAEIEFERACMGLPPLKTEQ
jgi:hypothetical protein